MKIPFAACALTGLMTGFSLLESCVPQAAKSVTFQNAPGIKAAKTYLSPSSLRFGLSVLDSATAGHVARHVMDMHRLAEPLTVDWRNYTLQNSDTVYTQMAMNADSIVVQAHGKHAAARVRFLRNGPVAAITAIQTQTDRTVDDSTRLLIDRNYRLDPASPVPDYTLTGQTIAVMRHGKILARGAYVTDGQHHSSRLEVMHGVPGTAAYRVSRMAFDGDSHAMFPHPAPPDPLYTSIDQNIRGMLSAGAYQAVQPYLVPRPR